MNAWLEAIKSATEYGKLHHSNTLNKTIEYGTAGFRSRSTDLDHVLYRVGLLAVVRSKFTNAAIGVMITASHNPVEDNGVKLVDPQGEMLESSWETYATFIANTSDTELGSALESIVTQTQTDFTRPATILFARDTRPSSVSLAQALCHGIQAFASPFTDYGILTTPQLHYMVRCTNSVYGQPTEAGYYSKLATAFQQANIQGTKECKYGGLLQLDGANGVGAPKMAAMLSALHNSTFNVKIYNDGSTGQLNHMCGADFVKVQQTPPQGLPVERGVRCASFDGDADRIVYYFIDSDGVFRLLDGDKISTLIASYLGELVREVGVSMRLGVVQTAYANGASTDYINNVAKLPVACVPTGVKHLHHRAQDFDIGVYFEANGHGTVLFRDSAVANIKQISNDAMEGSTRCAAQRLLATIDLINQTVGDAISDLLLVETILANRGWDIDIWNKAYTDLPNRQLKVKVADRRVIETTDAERKVTMPAGLQDAINRLVVKYTTARSFVRPSGTEDIVRVYAEADIQASADQLAYEVSLAVYDMAGGTGERPTLT